MSADFLLFLIVGFVAIAAATAMLFSRSALYAALFLITNFGAVAVLYLLLNAPFLAMVQISVYAGAIMVRFLFVIMLVGAERRGREPEAPTLRWQRPLAIVLAIVLVVQAAYVFITRAAAGPAPAETVDAGPLSIGKTLIGSYLLPFEVIAIVLLAAMVGAVVLTRERS
ncbi:MAG: NADH-quinone oxidoreductase subunit J [Anaerolineae bacterium]|nr:NADH-quinone oxidoreductase subunit J [Thermoflexales bacterium]MDW8407052.1 NADH-quinone oxidoreductase subunit J [Anaerolineae bacterium]